MVRIEHGIGAGIKGLRLRGGRVTYHINNDNRRKKGGRLVLKAAGRVFHLIN